MKNKENKKRILEDGTYQKYSKRQKELFKKGLNYDEVNEELKKEFKDQSDIIQMRRARRQQTKKIKNKLEYYTARKYDVYFATFTYSDDKRRKEMTPETLKHYVIKALKNADDYSLNIDYGAKNERLHYHALVYYKPKSEWNHAIKKKEYEKITDGKTKIIDDTVYIIPGDQNHRDYEKKVGTITLKKITFGDGTALARYITKLTLHSVKEKQKYVSSKKGSRYDKYLKLMDEAKKLNKKDNEYFYNYVGLIHTIKSTPYLLKAFQEIGEFKYDDINY